MASSQHVYSDLYLSPEDNSYDVDETLVSTDNLMNILHGDTDKFRATKLPNYNDSTSTKRKADCMTETSTSTAKKRTKQTKKSNGGTSKSVTEQSEKRSQPQTSETSNQPQASSTHVSPYIVSHKSIDTLYELNKRKERQKQKYSVIKSNIASVDNIIRHIDEYLDRENACKENRIELYDTKSSKNKEYWLNVRKHFHDLLISNEPEVCLMCNSNNPIVLGTCGHCFLCFKCYGGYITSAADNNRTQISCLKCHNYVNTSLLTC